MIIAEFETRNFTFTTLALTEALALAQLKAAWTAHKKEYGPGDYYDFDTELTDSVSYVEVEVGDALRDREKLIHYKAPTAAKPEHQVRSPFVKCDAIPNSALLSQLTGISDPCHGEVEYIDHKGFVYCAHHAPARNDRFKRRRKLTKAELKKLNAGETIVY